MSKAVARDMSWSATLFIEQVWPLIVKQLGGGELLQMEGRPDTQLARMLDMKAGIDGWHISGEGMRGIASRVQETTRPWNTFTVRMSRTSGATTEFEKRCLALKQVGRGWIYPSITVQAYAATKDGPVLTCGIAQTCDIIEFIERGLHKMNKTTNASFAVCHWDKMKNNGYRVEIINAEPQLHAA